MTPNEFAHRHEQEWKQLETLIAARPGHRPAQLDHRENQSDTPDGSGMELTPKRATNQAIFPSLYRRICLHLALSRERHYPPALIERLNHLALSGHQTLYGARPLRNIVQFIVCGFPTLIREHARLFWLASALLYLPALLMGLLVYFQPEMIYRLLDYKSVHHLEEMYSANGVIEIETGSGRVASENFSMLGFYIHNNITIGFQCFASGLLFGLGTLYFLIFNGLIFGAVSAHLIHQGSVERFFQFVIAHSAFELTAIVLCGMAGLLLGRALIAPGRRRRNEALTHAAGPAVQIVYGATAMLLIAAFIEAFWSSGAYLPVTGKFIVGGLLWALVAAYFLFMGVRRET
ncbi:MAG: stage II sporulation protein M [Betaproteobacteria bacterium]|nr:stage II sporulation protein M [Betaproteobacteria bacterium]